MKGIEVKKELFTTGELIVYLKGVNDNYFNTAFYFVDGNQFHQFIQDRLNRYQSQEIFPMDCEYLEISADVKIVRGVSDCYIKYKHSANTSNEQIDSVISIIDHLEGLRNDWLFSEFK
jgi:hypothetical protein